MRLYPDAKGEDSFQEGLDFQEFVAGQLQQKLGTRIDYYTTRDEQYLIGESQQGIEVKLDSRCTETGRLSIEIAEKTRASNWRFVPSGIYRQDNTTIYVQGNYIVFYIFQKARLIELHSVYRNTEAEKRGTIITYYLPLQVAMREALQIIRCK
jgi:hypothetical protein